MSKKSNIEHSKFWLGNDFDLDKELGKGDTIDLLRLAAYRRAISNFVLILTGKNIPVRFSEKSGRSMTDGKVVYIGGDLSRGEFDATVGLSLHEAMHIVESDFELIKTIWGKVPKSIYDLAGKKLSKNAIPDFVKYVLNVVEDRYIDALAYESAPGYRGYYVALYNRYFNTPKITEALASDAYRKPTLKAYRFRFTNITNPERDLDALPGLREIYKLLDMGNILRLTTPQDRMDMAVNISALIIKNIIKEDEKREEQKNDDVGAGNSSPDGNDEGEEDEGKNSQAGNGEEEETDENPIKATEASDEKSDEEEDCAKCESQNQSEDEDDPLGGIDGAAPRVSEEDKQNELEGENMEDKGDLTDKEMEELEKQIKKQEDVVNRDLKQKEFGEEAIKKLDLLEKSGVNLVPVGGEMGIPEVNCVVVRNMTKELMMTEEFPYTIKMRSLSLTEGAKEGVNAGVALGTMLGRRLQVRGESRTTRFNRLDKGKFDRRMIADLGFDCGSVFYQTQVDKFKSAHLHLTVDASSSMATKWQRTMTTVVAIAKAASMVNNLNVTISFRSGIPLNQKDVFNYNQIPYVVIAYDSRVDKFSKVTQLFPYLMASGSTPEGLAFQAILDTIPAATPELDSYFVNLSDGEPAFGLEYFGDIAHNHTKKQVNRIREVGIEVLSYFVEVVQEPTEKKDADEQEEAKSRISANTAAFRKMYGRDAQVIDVNNVKEIALTMNKKFLSKET